MANVSDWNKLENDSSKNKIYKNNSFLVKNRYKRYEINESPNKMICNNKEDNITNKLNK